MRHITRGTVQRRVAAIGVAFAMAAVSLAAPAHADPTGPSYGEARAIFQNGVSAGPALLTHNPDAPIAGVHEDGARILAYLDGFTYCDDGWHVVWIGLADTTEFWPDVNSLRAYVAGLDVEFTLDGAPLDVERTSVTAQNPAFVLPYHGFAVGFGSIVEPGGLAIGSHELITDVTDPVYGDVTLAISFTVADC